MVLGSSLLSLPFQNYILLPPLNSFGSSLLIPNMGPPSTPSSSNFCPRQLVLCRSVSEVIRMMALPNSESPHGSYYRQMHTPNPAAYSLQSPVWSVLCFLLWHFIPHHPHIPDTADWLPFLPAMLSSSRLRTRVLLFPLPAMLFLYVLTGLLLLSLRLQLQDCP